MELVALSVWAANVLTWTSTVVLAIFTSVINTVKLEKYGFLTERTA